MIQQRYHSFEREEHKISYAIFVQKVVHNLVKIFMAGGYEIRKG
jgi:hypothetical protein